jgi:hypothetical protein
VLCRWSVPQAPKQTSRYRYGALRNRAHVPDSTSLVRSIARCFAVLHEVSVMAEGDIGRGPPCCFRFESAKLIDETPRILASIRSKPTAFQTVSFEQRVPRLRQWKSAGIPARPARGLRSEVPHDLAYKISEEGTAREDSRLRTTAAATSFLSMKRKTEQYSFGITKKAILLWSPLISRFFLRA